VNGEANFSRPSMSGELDEVSGPRTPKASNIESHILRLLGHRTQTATAERMRCDNTTLNKFLSSPNGLGRACELLAALGLRVVDETQPVYDERYVESLETLAMHALNRRRSGRGEGG
jgi:hypothetical protein